jgi:hypothetical protein
MHKLRSLLAVLAVCQLKVLFAQQAELKGIIKDETGHAISEAQVHLLPVSVQALSNENGLFIFKSIPYGNYSVHISVQGKQNFIQDITVNQPVVDLHEITLHSETNPVTEEFPTVSLSDDELRASSTENNAVVLNASRDAFIAAAGFNFSIARFRLRGYDDENSVTLMNGAPMTDLVTGRNMYYTWSGLNDVFRSRENTYGLAAANYAFGGAGGSSMIDSRATRQRKQLQATYSLSNRSYDNRIMLTYGSGILKNGWSYALSGSKRWGDEGYVQGTFYDGYSYFGTIEKLIGIKHSLSLTAYGLQSKNGRSSLAVQELYDLAGTNFYNPNWGWQDGKKRNASVANNRSLSFTFMHDYKINNKQWLVTSLAFIKNTSKNSGLDWYNASNPRPDYYRNLPSYFSEFPSIQQQLIQLYQNNDSLLQINWNALYEANYKSDTTLTNANGIAGNNVTGRWSRYILEDRVTDNQFITFNSYYNCILSDKITLTAGIGYRNQQTGFYKEVKDLLGGDFYVDLNQYAELDNPGNNIVIQNDLNNPNRVLKEGDRFGYDYMAHITRMNIWAQAAYRSGTVDGFIAAEMVNTGYYREGLTKNGLFPDNSFGNSEKQSFTDPAVKAGLTYKLDGRNFLFVNGALISRAPFFENAYLSPRVQNTTAPGLTSEKITSMEGGYLMKAPRLKIRAVGYLTNFNDGVETRSFFNEATNSFGNLTLTGINKRHVGVELSVDRNFGKGISGNVAASLGQFYYSSRPTGTFTEDESATPRYTNETIYVKNLRIGGLPQTAVTAGVSYRSPRFWSVNLNANYFDDIFIDFSPIRRTVEALDLLDAGSEQYEKILKQEKADSKVTLDAFFSWSYKLNRSIRALKRNSFFVVNAGITNLLDEKNFKTGGFEQLRFDFAQQNPDKYPPKYFYAPGRTYFLSMIFRFN